ncbi:LysR family transcriptional regulator [Stappia taiwanensis]|uniref:LysR family transcriptional regulator n=1 Tax=Stappia taiwanensis TaxID=992267 RepID=A0A838XNC9_9HYPH|nr:LysR substrate-binding domain-containing protein [Stappia taiwanensis]MBA4610521.1 LysR family transcriptional regulator [Stappia taiwanensis]GGE84232.1 LysR family transcriptional regulator [Stappia taiwanensis]
MPKQLPPLNALRALATLARTGGVGLAADELGVTHAAVSHHLRNLEDWFGSTLVRRKGRRIELTPEAERIASTVNDALERIGAVCHEVAETARRPELLIACVPSFATRHLIPRLVDFGEIAPAIRLRLLYAQHGTPQDADILIDWFDTPPPQERYPVCLPLLSGHTRPVCSPAHLATHGPFETVRDIARARLLHDERRDDWRDWLGDNGQRSTLASEGPVFNDFNLLVSAVVAGHGVALCVETMITAELTRGDLIPLTDTLGNRERAYWLIATRAPSPAARRFIDWISRRMPATSLGKAG